MTLLQPGSVMMSVAHVTNWGSHGCPWSGLPPEDMLMSEGWVEMSPPLISSGRNGPTYQWRAGPSGSAKGELLPSLTSCHNVRAGSTPHHEHRGRTGPNNLCTEELAVTLAWEGWSWWRPGLTNSATTQDHIQGFELAHLNIYPICDLLELMKEPVLSRGIIATGSPWLSRRIPERSFNEGPTVKICQKLWTWPTTQCNEHLQVELFGQEGVLRDKPQLPRPLRQRNVWWRGGKEGGEKCFFVLLCFILSIFIFFSEERLQGWRIDMEGLENE